MFQESVAPTLSDEPVVSVEKLIVFCKAPRPGLVKTRLAASLGAEEACRIYQRMAERVMDRIEALDDVVLQFTPEDARAEVARWKRRPSWQLVPQCQGDLGNRMHRAFDQAFASGARRVLLIGTDAPEITAADLLEGYQALHESDVVIGPATDGGYWLLGMGELHPELFQSLPWSTPEVLQQTLVRAGSRGLRVRSLRLLSDIDDAADWNAYLDRQAER